MSKRLSYQRYKIIEGVIVILSSLAALQMGKAALYSKPSRLYTFERSNPNMKKRFMSLILAMLMTFSLVSTSAFALEVEDVAALDNSFALYNDA